jgi:hypothetical protein
VGRQPGRHPGQPDVAHPGGATLVVIDAYRSPSVEAGVAFHDIAVWLRPAE